MPQQDTSALKEKIIFIIKTRGPSLPAHIAGETGMNILFSSAFLSELISERKLKTSNLRVGSSPLYLIPGQEPLLEKSAHHLKSKEKEAFELLNQRKFLLDSEQEPAIRVALRAIKDFAIPFEKNNEIIWRYLTVPESEFQKDKKIEKQEVKKEDKKEKKLDIFNKPKKKRIVKRSQKLNEKFFSRVKEFLSQKQIEISSIEGFNKNELLLKIKQDNQEKLLVAYNKKRVDEKDIIKANKKSEELGLPYIIFSLGELSKKLNELLSAAKNLSGIGKIE